MKLYTNLLIIEKKNLNYENQNKFAIFKNFNRIKNFISTYLFIY